ncbi:MAG: ribonuclease HII [Bacilli bacterium]|nr:ribonuclease HII [Bacilli bacterium]
MNSYEFETKIYEEGYKYIAGCDEVGRGCIAGPVVACAVIMPKDCIIKGVTDSKLLTDKKRRLLKDEIISKALAYEVTFISHEEIDKINILEASRKAMTESVNNLKVKPDYVIADAMNLPIDIPTMSIIKGDLRSHTIACASIIAKVIRDDYMVELSKKYPGYDLEKNKGYPTPFHKQALFIHGVTEIHRKTYEPVRLALEKDQVHHMRLWPSPFKKIKSGTKTVELRLNDEKRKIIVENDLIEFENIETSEKLLVKVKKIKPYSNFNELYLDYDKIAMGYDEDEIPNPSDMETYYSKKDIKKYGCLAIEINRI